MPAKTLNRTKPCGRVCIPLVLTLPLGISHIYFPAYYNAGSATLVLILIFIVIGVFIWYRLRRNKVQLFIHQDQVEETIPLNRRGNGEVEDGEVTQQRKGKERLREPEPERELAASPISNVGIVRMKSINGLLVENDFVWL